MSEPNSTEQIPNNATLATTNENTIEAESITIISAAQIQSIDVSTQFRRETKETGWILTLFQSCRVVVNLSTSMRKIEILLLEGDQLVKEKEDLLIVRKQTADQYRNHRATSSLAKSRDELLRTNTETI
jgi:hypothetical protein